MVGYDEKTRIMVQTTIFPPLLQGNQLLLIHKDKGQGNASSRTHHLHHQQGRWYYTALLRVNTHLLDLIYDSR